MRLLADAGAVLDWKSKGPNEPALTMDLSGATAACEILVSGLAVRHASPYLLLTTPLPWPYDTHIARRAHV